jgi:hypothetical protein
LTSSISQNTSVSTTKQNEILLNKVKDLEDKLLSISLSSREQQERRLTRTRCFDDVRELLKPNTKSKWKNRKPKSKKPGLKDKESLKMKIVKAAKNCKNGEDLRLLLEQLLNEGKQLEYGNIKVTLNINKDALDQMIEKNCFSPIDQWRCPICFEEIDAIEEDEKSQWEAHLNLKHNIGSYLFENIYPFILYGDAIDTSAFFSKNNMIKSP